MLLPSNRARGFTLIEVLLVLAILGIISAIAIPSFLGQRRRARVIGDARSNAYVLIMALESRKADLGTYGIAGVYTWKADGSRPSTDLAPTFIPKGSSQMNYSVTVKADGISYDLSVTDPILNDASVLTANQSGAIALNTVYNK
ncbi:type IV pilin protein [Geothrix sp. PMB-07]|uniref:type IV pilin protein n=1 Tax=Geothrix sp. PMB-07 TaxID=3068640 RepID=UPI00274182B7|nr:type II secretion system protein [Geothrix sp. PMB-07]WLT30605.1 type II secretion system protein [Geothrix sp. PMB-07]